MRPPAWIGALAASGGEKGADEGSPCQSLDKSRACLAPADPAPPGVWAPNTTTNRASRDGGALPLGAEGRFSAIGAPIRRRQAKAGAARKADPTLQDPAAPAKATGRHIIAALAAVIVLAMSWSMRQAMLAQFEPDGWTRMQAEPIVNLVVLLGACLGLLIVMNTGRVEEGRDA